MKKRKNTRDIFCFVKVQNLYGDTIHEQDSVKAQKDCNSSHFTKNTWPIDQFTD